ncbi:hypothetical protein K501DRAFT_273864 [Backusella circina FSU 941]|nr:hypothetical protein K501DRAFT_273864 [Backusella circina FSU 941]
MALSLINSSKIFYAKKKVFVFVFYFILFVYILQYVLIPSHTLNCNELLASTSRRKSNLTSKDVERVNEGIERNVPTAINQKSINTLENKLDIQSEDGATILLKYTESKQFITKYRCDPTTNALDGLFIANKTLIARTKRFPEVIIIIPEIKNTLITSESNIGGCISLPKSKDIKYPGRPPKLPRLSSLKKDYSSSEYRKIMLLYGKRALIGAEADGKDEKCQDESDKDVHVDVKESNTSISTNLLNDKLYIPQKRKTLRVLNEKNNKVYETEDLFKPQKKRITIT